MSTVATENLLLTAPEVAIEAGGEGMSRGERKLCYIAIAFATAVERLS